MNKVDFSQWRNRFNDVLIGVFEEAIEADPEEAQKAVIAFKPLNQRVIGRRLSKTQSEAADLAREVVSLDPSVQ